MEILIFIFPFLSFVVSFLPFSNKYLNIAFFINFIFMLFSFCLSVYLFIKLFQLNNDEPLYFYPLIQSNQNLVDWSLRLDLYVSVFLIVVTFVSLLVIINLVNIFKNSHLNLKLIRNLSLLTLGMLFIISSNNLIQFFISWQIIILSFYNLIKNVNSNYAISNNSTIFMHNRLSDLGVFLSIYALFTLNNSIYFETIFDISNLVHNNIIILGINTNKAELAVFFLFFSLLLRFRQFFISNSIYDIKNINIPILTSIFCSAMIPLTIFFIYRFFPLIYTSPNFLNIIITLSLCLALIFIYLSFKTTDIKFLISYVVSSQACMIIYIFCLKEYHAAIFYFCSVSLSITMLYLCLGFVVFKLNNVSNVKDMGGLFFKMPAMFLFTLIAFFSISGIPFFSGYYSNQVIFSSLYFSQEVLLIPSLLLGISFSFLISYILLKNILLIFFGNNKGNIHQFNKVNDSSFINKFIFLCLGLCVVFAGWLSKNLFDGANAEYLWSLLIYNDVSFSISAEVNSSENFKDLLILFSLVGIFFAVVNYIIMPFILNNYKLKYYKIFILYSKYFLRF